MKTIRLKGTARIRKRWNEDTGRDEHHFHARREIIVPQEGD